MGNVSNKLATKKEPQTNTNVAPIGTDSDSNTGAQQDTSNKIKGGVENTLLWKVIKKKMGGNSGLNALFHPTLPTSSNQPQSSSATTSGSSSSSSKDSSSSTSTPKKATSNTTPSLTTNKKRKVGLNTSR